MLKQKLKNMFKGRNYNFYLSNTVVNGRKTGCSDFIVNSHNNVTVYVNTEKSCLATLSDKIFVRYAKDTHDYTGGINNFVKEDKIVEQITRMLEKPDKKEFLWEVNI